MLDTLVPVIVGGIIGVMGGLVGPPLAHWLNEKGERRKIRSQKFEELIEQVHAFDHWLDLQRAHHLWGGNAPEEASPLPRAQAIALVYFPSVLPRLKLIEVHARGCQKWLFAAAQKKLEGRESEVKDGFKEAYEPYWNSVAQVMDDLRDLSAAEFHSPRSSVPAPATSRREDPLSG